MKDLNPATVDLNFGIEFIGGVRIPISLERSVDSQTMGGMVDTIKTRISKFGLTQANVRPLGDKEIIVEIPRADSSAIKHIEAILREQGHFEAVIDGKLALDGTQILANAVGGAGSETVEPGQTPEQVVWTIVFAVSGDGQWQFAEAAAGKLHYPVYMFLDRPQRAALLVKQADLGGLTGGEAVLTDALAKQGDDVKLFYVEEFAKHKNELLAPNASNAGITTIIVSESLEKTDPEIYAELKAAGFLPLGEAPENSTRELVVKPESEIKPTVITAATQTGTETILTSWPAIGLRSAPTLNVEPIKQRAITQYSITGTSSGNTTEEAKKNAIGEIKELKSILSGGKLPVATVIGSYYDIAPSLGTEFLRYSMIGLVLAITAVSLVIVARYRKFKLIVPIVVTNVVEIIVLAAVVGTIGTIELSAMAGIITLIGMGVNDQIIVVEELLGKRSPEEMEEAASKRGTAERIKRAFYVIFIVAGVATASMLPLLLSGMVEATGFAMSTILGVFIGVFITRPAFGVVAGELFKHG
jgi:preprotein translocase subunit SecD